MTSWRDGLPEDAQVELDKVLTAAVSFAQRMLEGHGAFYPYAVGLNQAGETEMATVPAGSEDALQVLLAGLIMQRASLNAGAVVAAVHLESIESDAVRVDIEHREGAALTLVIPYTRKKLRRKIDWGDMQSMVVDPRIWTT